jgi:hypothetical protein
MRKQRPSESELICAKKVADGNAFIEQPTFVPQVPKPYQSPTKATSHSASLGLD